MNNKYSTFLSLLLTWPPHCARCQTCALEAATATNAKTSLVTQTGCRSPIPAAPAFEGRWLWPLAGFCRRATGRAAQYAHGIRFRPALHRRGSLRLRARCFCLSLFRLVSPKKTTKLTRLIHKRKISQTFFGCKFLQSCQSCSLFVCA